MPDANTVLLPICVALALVGVIITGLAWRRRNKGRVLQGLAIAIAPVGLYFTGLLGLVWDGIAAVADWAVNLVISPLVWIGFSILGFCLVLFVVGGLVSRVVGGGPAVEKSAAKPAAGRGQSSGQKAVAGKQPAKAGKTGKAGKTDEQVDPELAEIEALLKSRGIE